MQLEFIMMKMKRMVLRWALALAATGMLAGPALAAEGLYAEVPGVLALQPVQAVAVAELVAERPTQPALAELPALVAAGSLPAELPVLALTPPEPFSAADLQALFVPGHEPLRVAVLSPQEMEETKGALAPFAVGGLVGGAVGGGGFALGVWRGNHAWNTHRFLGNVATGAVIGGSFGAAGAAASGGM
ncbi:MAG: hypothetical protein M1359_02630 [Betaproteobacteria bacterium]|jgi:hypothetical protein|uniref:Uncharacterized protein n=2 Tax=Serpentinimonas maccroryi TaxID=1458426 RepID=A0A060NWI8_9BURK|nr:hypothetical protein [Serpentinimonas maccroryi]MCL5968169.1 hypothetical protein [Betaproteobacteria bacterium]BAO83883.1 hypothetical protein SMCB_1655 [Serpentinimonas maccroryi]